MLSSTNLLPLLTEEPAAGEGGMTFACPAFRVSNNPATNIIIPSMYNNCLILYSTLFTIREKKSNSVICIFFFRSRMYHECPTKCLWSQYLLEKVQGVLGIIMVHKASHKLTKTLNLLHIYTQVLWDVLGGELHRCTF